MQASQLRNWRIELSRYTCKGDPATTQEIFAAKELTPEELVELRKTLTAKQLAEKSKGSGRKSTTIPENGVIDRDLLGFIEFCRGRWDEQYFRRKRPKSDPSSVPLQKLKQPTDIVNTTRSDTINIQQVTHPEEKDPNHPGAPGEVIPDETGLDPRPDAHVGGVGGIAVKKHPPYPKTEGEFLTAIPVIKETPGRGDDKSTPPDQSVTKDITWIIQLSR